MTNSPVVFGRDSTVGEDEPIENPDRKMRNAGAAIIERLCRCAIVVVIDCDFSYLSNTPRQGLSDFELLARYRNIC